MLNSSFVFLSQRSKANAQMTHIQNKKQTKTEEEKRRKKHLFFKLLDHENSSKSPNWYDCMKPMKKIVIYIYAEFQKLI